MRLFFYYNFLMLLGIIAAGPLLIPWIAASPKRRRTFPRRLGVPHLRPPGPRPLWIHALSVGEVVSAVPLVERLAKEAGGRPLVFSCATLTGFATASKMLAGRVAAFFYAPYDLLPLVRRMCRHLDPAAVIVVETDLWPNFLWQLQRQNVPVLLVNTRLSESSFRGYRRLSFFMGPVFRRLTRICPQTSKDARRFHRLGVPWNKIVVTGNLKYDQDIPQIHHRDELLQSLHLPAGCRVLVAGSTHPGEEQIIAQAMGALAESEVPCKLIVAPRDHRRASTVRRLFTRSGFHSRCLQADGTGSGTWDVLVIDTIGPLRTLYGAGSAAFVGGSLVPAGGHNPLEPAALAKPVLFGPDMSDFSAVAAALLDAGAARRVGDARELEREFKRIACDQSRAVEMGAAARQVFLANRGAVDRTVDIVRRCLKETENGRGVF